MNAAARNEPPPAAPPSEADANTCPIPRVAPRDGSVDPASRAADTSETAAMTDESRRASRANRSGKTLAEQEALDAKVDELLVIPPP